MEVLQELPVVLWLASSSGQRQGVVFQFLETSSDRGLIGGIVGFMVGGLGGAGVGAGIASAVSNEQYVMIYAREIFEQLPGFREKDNTVYCELP